MLMGGWDTLYVKIGFHRPFVFIILVSNFFMEIRGCIECLNKIGILIFGQTDSRTAEAFAAVAVLILENMQV
jgi:hypothetical protein